MGSIFRDRISIGYTLKARWLNDSQPSAEGTR